MHLEPRKRGSFVRLMFERAGRVSFVNFVLWSLRVSVVVVVIGGIAGTLVKGRYTGEQWFAFVTFGLTMGGIYALIALGYTMVFGILRLINFAHGDIFMTGAFTGYFVAAPMGRSGFIDAQPVLAISMILVVACTTSTVMALAVERVTSRPFRHVKSLAPLICAIGASFFLQHAFRAMYGSGVRAYPEMRVLTGSIGAFGVEMPRMQVIVSLSALVTMSILYAVVQWTKFGIAMRAVSEDRDAAALMGIDINRIIVFTFVLGGVMAGVAGVLYAFVFKQVHFFMGFFPGIKAFSAAVLGGIGNIPGAMLGGLLLGVVESVGPALFLDGIGIPASYQLRDVIAYTILLMILIFRPSGILGERFATKRA